MRARVAARSMFRPAKAVAGCLVVALLVGGCGQSSYQYNWNILVDSVVRPDRLILSGLWLTLSISVISQTIGVVLGVLGGLGKMSRIAPLRWLANLYVWFFRGTPLLVQITFIYFGLGVTRIYQWPEIHLFGFGVDGAIQAGIFALGVNEGASVGLGEGTAVSVGAAGGRGGATRVGASAEEPCGGGAASGAGRRNTGTRPGASPS